MEDEMNKIDELKSALAKRLFDQNGMANSAEVVEDLVALIVALIEEKEDLINPTI
jgi:hypothetical protein